jgi:hypothetical protein
MDITTLSPCIRGCMHLCFIVWRNHSITALSVGVFPRSGAVPAARWGRGVLKREMAPPHPNCYMSVSTARWYRYWRIINSYESSQMRGERRDCVYVWLNEETGRPVTGCNCKLHMSSISRCKHERIMGSAWLCPSVCTKLLMQFGLHSWVDR